MMRGRAGIRLGRLLLAASLCASPAAVLAAADLTGTWRVTFSGPTDTCTFTLMQSPAADVTGTLTDCMLGTDGTVTGTVDAASGDFRLDIVAPGDTLCETYFMVGTVSGDDVAGTYHCTSPSTLTGPFTGTRPSLCGNFVVDPGEDCDPGPDRPRDCCSPTCRFELALAPCAADGDLCTVEQCDGAGTCVATACSPCCAPDAGCVPAPAAPCRAAILPGGSLAVRHDLPDDRRERLGWTWVHGAQTTLSDFGDPVTAADYTLCLYDAAVSAPRLLLAATVAHGGTCADKACWRSTKTGFRYGDRLGTVGGMQKILLHAGADGSAKIAVKGRGERLFEDGTMPGALQLPVTMEVLTGTACWASTYQSARTNTGDVFRARGGE